MSHEELIHNLTNDADLRDRFRQAPDEVVEQHGIELNEDQRRRLKAEDWASSNDEELVSKVSSTPGLHAWL